MTGLDAMPRGYIFDAASRVGSGFRSAAPE
ncbi:hypothetical protein CLBKND_03117 [Methylorubrum aminovorans]